MFNLYLISMPESQPRGSASKFIPAYAGHVPGIPQAKQTLNREVNASVDSASRLVEILFSHVELYYNRGDGGSIPSGGVSRCSAFVPCFLCARGFPGLIDGGEYCEEMRARCVLGLSTSVGKKPNDLQGLESA